MVTTENVAWQDNFNFHSQDNEFRLSCVNSSGEENFTDFYVKKIWLQNIEDLAKDNRTDCPVQVKDG